MMIKDLEGLCLLVCIFESLLLIEVCVCTSKSLHKKVEHLGSMFGKMYISSLLGRDEAYNGGCLGGHLADLCVDV